MALEMAIQVEQLAILSSTNGTRNDLLLSFPKALGFFALHSSRPEPTQIKFVVLVLSEAVLSPPRRTVLVLKGCLNSGADDR
ncbi:MAG: hypothetical protein ACOYKN_19350 [Pirellula sp.]